MSWWAWLIISLVGFWAVLWFVTFVFFGAFLKGISSIMKKEL